MADRLAEVEARLTAIELRLSALESDRGVPAAAGVPSAGPGPLGEESVSNAATHLGRVLLIFGGAYLLRAITDFGFLPTQAGIPIGAIYALIWLYMAWRFGGRPQERTAAMLYGGVSVLLVLPILVEAVTRFDLLGGTSSAIALIVFCAAALGVAVTRNLKSLAWLTTAGALGTALVLLRASGAAVTFSVVMLAVGLASYWVVYVARWMGVQWVGAAGADAGVVLLAVLSLSEQWTVSPVAGFVLGLAMWGGYLVSFALRSHVLGREPGIFEAAQTALASAIVFAVALYVGRTVPGEVVGLGAAALVFGAAAYGLAFTRKAREARGRNFYFYSTLGLALVIGGSALLVAPRATAVAWALFAVALGWLSGQQERVSLSLQSAVALVAAGVASGALATGIRAFVGDPAAGWPALGVSSVVVAAAAVACLFIPVAQHSDRWGKASRIPQLIVLLLSVWAVGGLMVVVAAPWLAGAPGPSTDLGSLATLRTGVLAAAAVTLALSSRHRRWPEARWLAYPVLVVVGVKLVFEDFPHGRPVTLFMALGLVGGALIIVSRLMRRKKPEPQAAEPATA